MGTFKHEYLPDDELVQLIVSSGSRAEAARNLGISESTLKTHIRRQGLNDKIEEELSRRLNKVTANIVELEEEISREEILEAELKELRSFVSKTRKGDVAQERLVTAVESALESVDVPPRRKSQAPAEKNPGAHHRQVLLLSDFHGGEVVDAESVNYLNEYNWSIQQQRVDEVIESALSHKRNSPELSGLDVILVGDMCSGSNHAEIIETNEHPAAEQGVKMGYLIGQTIERLAEHYTDVNVSGVVGNHPRIPAKPAAKQIFDNFDWIAYIIGKEYTNRLDNVTFTVPKSGAYFHEVAGQTLYVWHGDGVRSTMPGVPWGGVVRRVNEIRRTHQNRKIDGFVLGHFHQANVMVDLGIYMNGSLKGTDEWVLKNFGSGTRPCQLLLTFDEKRSRLTDTRFITPTAGIPEL